jgi:hypothetical protein
LKAIALLTKMAVQHHVILLPQTYKIISHTQPGPNFVLTASYVDLLAYSYEVFSPFFEACIRLFISMSSTKFDDKKMVALNVS